MKPLSAKDWKLDPIVILAFVVDDQTVLAVIAKPEGGRLQAIPIDEVRLVHPTTEWPIPEEKE